VARRVQIEPMAAADWPEVRRIYAEGIATGDATFESDVPDWSHWDRSHRPECRLVARDPKTGEVIGWAALTLASSRRVYSGVAWESVYVADAWRGRGVGRALLKALIPASEKAGYWTLQAGVLVENEASLALHEAVGFRRVGVQERIGRDARGAWRDRVLLERRSTKTGV
jgi:L-amino acid N-acyltransferase YncA